MRRRSAPPLVPILAGLAGLFGAATLLAAPDAAASDAAASPRARAAAALLASLPAEQRDDATWPFADAERGDIRYAPIWLDGVRDDALPAAAREPADALLAATLSPAGRERVEQIRELERAVLALERERFWGFATRWLRDPGRYLWAFFGEPGPGPWAFRLEGHHLSLHLTEVPGRTPASTPLFLGARPRVVPEGLPGAGSAALGEEERLARALYASLDPEQRAAATLPYADDRGHLLGQVARLDPPAPEGVRRAELRPDQRALLDAFLDRFAALWAEPIAAARRSEIAAAREHLRFAHVEADDPPHAFYTRVSGPGLFVEIDNTTDGDHVHAVWHRPGADFGRDLLAHHLRQHHGIALGR